MWLLDVKTYTLTDVINPAGIRYAILSHTWSVGEISFTDIQRPELARKKLGWHKIEQTCRVAAERGIRYVWIDTCCIDKSSSAELSEAINSMFAWYKASAECYVHLEDLDGWACDSDLHHSLWAGNSDLGRFGCLICDPVLAAALPACRWFTRGWTLQELIAPKNLYFYDRNWERRGMKSSLKTVLSGITKIDPETLLDPERLSLIPVGKRMSWAASRETTRVEDMAYCLLGIFGVNMPLIYGEGANAFLRLQEAVALATEDLSLFAWTGESGSRGLPYSGVLARAPSQFASCSFLENIDDPLEYDSRSFTMINRRVGFQACLKTEKSQGDYLMRLHCRNADDPELSTVVIRLVKTPGGFVRHRTDSTFHGDQHHGITDPSSWDPVPRMVSIPKTLQYADLVKVRHRYNDSFQFKVTTTEDWYYKLTASLPDLIDETPNSTHWDSSTNKFMTEGHPMFAGLLTGTIYDSTGAFLTQFLVFFGFCDQRARTDGKVGLKPWIALSGDGEALQAPAEESGIFDLPEGVMSERLRMNYPRFLSYAARFFRAQMQATGKAQMQAQAEVDDAMKAGRQMLTDLGEPGDSDFSGSEAGSTGATSNKAKSDISGKQLRQNLTYERPRVFVSASINTLDAGDYTTHRVSMKLSPQVEETTSQKAYIYRFGRGYNGYEACELDGEGGYR